MSDWSKHDLIDTGIIPQDENQKLPTNPAFDKDPYTTVNPNMNKDLDQMYKRGESPFPKYRMTDEQMEYARRKRTSNPKCDYNMEAVKKMYDKLVKEQDAEDAAKAAKAAKEGKTFKRGRSAKDEEKFVEDLERLEKGKHPGVNFIKNPNGTFKNFPINPEYLKPGYKIDDLDDRSKPLIQTSLHPKYPKNWYTDKPFAKLRKRPDQLTNADFRRIELSARRGYE